MSKSQTSLRRSCRGDLRPCPRLAIRLCNEKEPAQRTPVAPEAVQARSHRGQVNLSSRFHGAGSGSCQESSSCRASLGERKEALERASSAVSGWPRYRSTGMMSRGRDGRNMTGSSGHRGRSLRQSAGPSPGRVRVRGHRVSSVLLAGRPSGRREQLSGLHSQLLFRFRLGPWSEASCVPPGLPASPRISLRRPRHRPESHRLDLPGVRTR